MKTPRAARCVLRGGRPAISALRDAGCGLRGRRQSFLVAAVVAAALAVSACTTTPQPATPAPDPSPVAGVTRANAIWGIEAREHVDLWLHGFAILQRDSARVPFFERGYAQRYQALKSRENVVTILDANRDRLEPSIAAKINAQFLPLYFATWEDMARSIDLALEVEGEARRVADPAMQRAVAVVASYFPLAADREWLRIYMQSLREERDRFWRTWWHERQRELEPALARLDTLWQDRYRPEFQRFLTNSRLPNGDFLVSLPLDGEGRALLNPTGIRVNIIAVASPASVERAVEPIYVFAHEIVGTLASSVLQDNLSPAERRQGLEAQLSGNALVRGGAILLQRVAPELADGYARYYLEAAAVRVPATNVQAALATAFPLPDAVSQALARQIDAILGGI